MVEQSNWNHWDSHRHGERAFGLQTSGDQRHGRLKARALDIVPTVPDAALLFKIPNGTDGPLPPLQVGNDRI